MIYYLDLPQSTLIMKWAVATIKVHSCLILI